MKERTKNINRYLPALLLAAALCSLPSGARGQYLKRETVTVTVKDAQGAGTKTDKTYAVVYADGLTESAVWPMGTNLMKGGATIRHQVSGGNDGNLPVNDRVSARFIVAETDHGNTINLYFIWAAGYENQNAQDLNATFGTSPSAQDRGCYGWGRDGQPGSGRTWRVPTQRELQLMRIFRDGINTIYPSAQMTGVYWSSTEKSTTEAWTVSFDEGDFTTTGTSKTATGIKLRCVSDY